MPAKISQDLEYNVIKPRMRKLEPESIDKIFYKIKERLSRMPTYSEFQKEGKGALGAIVEGRYSPKIRRWSQYLESKGKIKMDAKKVDEIFDELKETLDRVPTYSEFQKEGKGALSAIVGGKYSTKIRKWSQYLKSRGINNEKESWNPEKIDKTFDKLKEKLGMTPKKEEFRERYGGAFSAIRDGRYSPKINNWTQYLKHKGIKPLYKWGYFTPKNIDDAFDKLRQELNRVPTSTEFGKEFRGALFAIIHKKYSSKINTWNQYVEHRGFNTRNSWNPEKIDKKFNDLIEKLNRVPFAKELGWGAIDSIRKGRYSPEIRSYSQYLEHKGLIKGNIKQILDEMLNDYIMQGGEK
jgi:hypothetical protein